MMRAFLLCLFMIAFALPSFAADKVLDVQKIKSPGGIEIWLVQDKTVPVVSINFSFEGGLLYDPEEKPGVGKLVSILLDEGAGDIKSQDFQAKLSDNAIQMGFTAGRDAFYGQLKTLKEKSTLAYDLLKLALTKPRFDDDAIERMRNSNVSSIKDDMGDPGWLVARSFNGMVFEGHTYSLPGAGSLASMQQIRRADLQEFVRSQFAKDVLKVAVAGDISADEAGKAIDTIFGSLPEKSEPVEKKDATLNYAGKMVLLPLDTPQTYISAGEAGISRSDADWHAAVIMNYILGGSSDARLMTEIREKRGLTYGVYTNLNSMKYASLLQANMSVSNEKVEDALKLLKEEWGKMAKDGPSLQEIEDAKAYLTGSLLLDLTSTDDISAALNGMQRDGMDADYINRRNDLLNAVMPADVKRVAARLMKPENLTIVMVGQPKNIVADIMLDHPPGMPMPEKKP